MFPYSPIGSKNGARVRGGTYPAAFVAAEEIIAMRRHWIASGRLVKANLQLELASIAQADGEVTVPQDAMRLQHEWEKIAWAAEYLSVPRESQQLPLS